MSVNHDKRRGTIVVKWYERDAAGKLVYNPANGKPIQHSKCGFGRWDDPVAMRLATEEDERLNPKSKTPESLRVLDIFNKFLEAKVGDVTTGYINRLRWMFSGSVMPALGMDRKVSELNEEVLSQYRNARLKTTRWRHQKFGMKPNGTVSKRTVAHEIMAIKYILRWAVEKHIIPYSPVEGFKVKGYKKAKEDPPTRAELAALIKAALPYSSVHRMLVLGSAIGARVGPSELFKITWLNVDFERRIVNVHSADKGGDILVRPVPVTDDGVWAQLLKFRQKDGTDYFGTIVHYRKKPIKSSVNNAWQACKKRAGITRKMTPYSLRHFFATDWVQSGGNIYRGAEMIGDDFATFAKTYVHGGGTPEHWQDMAKRPPLPIDESCTSTPSEPCVIEGEHITQSIPANPRRLRVVK